MSKKENSIEKIKKEKAASDRDRESEREGTKNNYFGENNEKS